MKRVIILLSVLALALITAAPAMAQEPCSEFVGQEKEYCLGALQEFEAESNPTGIPASASASASAPSGSQYQYSTPAESQYSAPAGELPPTGGFPWLLFVGVATLIGGIIVASRLYLSHRLSTR